MAEYKNGVNFRGNMSVEKNNVNSDVQTGRAIFVDEDKYEKDSVYKAKVDKCLAEGFHRVGSSEGGGGSSDFSMATVTVNIARGTPSFSGIFILPTGEPSQPYYMTYGNQNFHDGDVIRAVMYNGEGYMEIELTGGGGTALSVSGAGDVEIEMDGSHAYASITGDCTITIS